MGDATARSNPKSSENSCHHEVGKSQHRPGGHASKARGGAHGLVQRQIEASAFWEYHLPDDGRKWRVQCARRRRLGLYLAGYPACYPGLKRIARDLRWSRRTVAVVMAQLKRLGVMVPQGYVTEHGTRLRVLKPEALRSRSRESCTPARGESCTQELPKKFHKDLKSDEADTATTAAAPAPYKETVKPTKYTPQSNPTTSTLRRHTAQSAFDTAVRIFTSSTYFEMPEYLAQGLACWIALRSIRRKSATRANEKARQAPTTVAYYIQGADNFFERYDEATQIQLMQEGLYRYLVETGQPTDDCEKPLSKAERLAITSAAERREARTKAALERVLGKFSEDDEEFGEEDDEVEGVTESRGVGKEFEHLVRQPVESRGERAVDELKREEEARRATAAKIALCAHSQPSSEKSSSEEEAATLVPISLASLAKPKSIPRGMSQAELDARRREMLLQAEKIKRDYPVREALVAGPRGVR